MTRDSIGARIDCALEKVRAQKMEVRAIYLCEADYGQLLKCHTRYWRRALKSRASFHPLSYGDHPIRFGENSVVYSTHGVGVAVPKRLSFRVAA